MAKHLPKLANLPVMTAALAAEPIFHIGIFPVTNSQINAWIVAAGFCVLAFVLSKRTGLVPRGIHNAFEAVVEGAISQMEQVTGDKKKARVFFPFVATLFFYILANNWLGLLPGTGTIGIWGEHHGEAALIPLLRPAGADLNFTLALAVLSVIVIQAAGIQMTGLMNYGSKFLNFRGVIQAIPKGPIAVGVAFVEFFVGLIEIVGEFAKMLSLSLRLFGNVFAGEILIGVMLGLMPFVVPLPFFLLELLVGAIQATVFAVLVLTFLTVATTGHGDHADEHEPAHH